MRNSTGLILTGLNTKNLSIADWKPAVGPVRLRGEQDPRFRQAEGKTQRARGLLSGFRQQVAEADR